MSNTVPPLPMHAQSTQRTADVAPVVTVLGTLVRVGQPCLVNKMSTIAIMLTIPIRELQQRGTKAIAKGSSGPVLVTGRPGALFYLVPADPERLVEQEIELSRAMARADLRSWQTRAVATGLDQTTSDVIEAEIAAVRRERRIRPAGGKNRRPARP